MSYLLDALRKAERDRKVGQPPSLQIVDLRGTQAAGPQRRLVLALGATAAVLLVTVILLLMTRHGAPAVAAVPAPPTPIAAPVADSGGPRSLDELAAPAAPEPEPLLETAQVSPPAPAPSAAPAVAAPPPTLDTHADAPAPEEPEAPEAEATPLRELPPAVRADFPGLRIEVHVYDDDPAKRWILVNGQRYREGEVLSEGPQLVEIRPDGVVVEHRGERALVPVGR